MRYSLPGIGLIKSENAAKPPSQGSKYFRNIVSTLPLSSRTLDYGCGKGRYVEDFQQVSEELYVLDSDTQLFRKQKFGSRICSISELYEGRNNIHLIRKNQISNFGNFFDRVFNVNVMSAIPFEAVRRKIASEISTVLKNGGQCVATHQYRNSDFSRMAKMSNAFAYFDGFIIKSLRGPSFYSPMPFRKFESYWTNAGLIVTDKKLHDGTIVLTLKKLD